MCFRGGVYSHFHQPRTQGLGVDSPDQPHPIRIQSALRVRTVTVSVLLKSCVNAEQWLLSSARSLQRRPLLQHCQKCCFENLVSTLFVTNGNTLFAGCFPSTRRVWRSLMTNARHCCTKIPCSKASRIITATCARNPEITKVGFASAANKLLYGNTDHRNVREGGGGEQRE